MKSKLLFTAIFLSDMVFLLISHLTSQALSSFELPAKILLFVLFTLLLIADEVWAAALFLTTSIVFGVNGELHRFPGGVPLSVYFLTLLLLRVVLFKNQRAYLFQRIQQSSLSVFVALAGILVPLAGIVVGFARRNDPAFIVSDADSWVLYLFFFCLLGLIRDQRGLASLVWSFLLGSGISAFLQIVTYFLFVFDRLTIPAISHFYYQVLNLGGLLIFKDIGSLRIYTGAVIILPVAMSFVQIMLLLRRKWGFLVWFFVFLILLQSLVISSTVAAWFSVTLTTFFIFFFLPSARLKREFFVLCGTITLILIIALSGTGMAPPQSVGWAYDRMNETIEQCADVLHSEFSLEKISDGGNSTTIKLKQYLALIRHTMRNPWWGHGFGATLPGQRTFRLTREKPFIFEAGYADLLMKAGFIGFSLWCSLIVALWYHWIVVFRASPYYTRFIVLVFGFPLAGTLLAYAPNPYLSSFFGILNLVMSSFVLDQILWMKRSGIPIDGTLFFEHDQQHPSSVPEKR
jgi:hypothetical protein